MIFQELKIKGAWLIEPEKQEDERGFFARTWCQREFAARGLTTMFVQCNISFNKRKGTLRGLHYQAAPYEEAKMVRVTKGAIYDVIVDLRPDSPTYLHWLAVELTGDNYRMLYIPEGVAHGFQTLENNTEIFYQMSEFYHPDAARGIRWDNQTLNITWPLPQPIISPKDLSFPNLGFWRTAGDRPVLFEAGNSIMDENCP
ncbi:MAG: dTDP-4-dehydrorhamnose 3,5-epimerase [Desulfobacca sp.]|nr:dTDP-4-dehydrorhamnose 3,5-epimerase [Desulfobacca sp.]